MRFLDIGAGKARGRGGAPFLGWDRISLDIDPLREPDILLDARELGTLEAAQYDGVLCAFNLQSYYAHEVPVVLKGILHVLKPDGFAEFLVSDLGAVIKKLAASDLDIDGELYGTGAGPIAALDLIFGYRPHLETAGNTFEANHTGFTTKTLRSALRGGGFATTVVTRIEPMGLRALAFRKTPSPALQKQLGIRL